MKDGVAKKLVEASAVFDATDKEKKCVKQILTRNWKDDLLNLFFKEKMSHISTDRRVREILHYLTNMGMFQKNNKSIPT